MKITRKYKEESGIYLVFLGFILTAIGYFALGDLLYYYNYVPLEYLVHRFVPGGLVATFTILGVCSLLGLVGVFFLVSTVIQGGWQFVLQVVRQSKGRSRRKNGDVTARNCIG